MFRIIKRCKRFLVFSVCCHGNPFSLIALSPFTFSQILSPFVITLLHCFRENRSVNDFFSYFFSTIFPLRWTCIDGFYKHKSLDGFLSVFPLVKSKGFFFSKRKHKERKKFFIQRVKSEENVFACCILTTKRNDGWFY